MNNNLNSTISDNLNLILGGPEEDLDLEDLKAIFDEISEPGFFEKPAEDKGDKPSKATKPIHQETIVTIVTEIREKGMPMQQGAEGNAESTPAEENQKFVISILKKHKVRPKISII